MRFLKVRFLAVFAVLIPILGVGMPDAQGMDTVAKQAIVLDAGTGTVLLEKNADQRVPPSSMSKLMTVYMLFERLQDGSLSEDDTFLVSEKAWRKGGSKMFVKVGDRVKISDLLRGIIVQSGNDATIVVAEGLAGSEEAFAQRMTARARDLGMTDSTFLNASGWPAEGHMMTVRDIARLSQRIIEDFPDYYRVYSETSFTYNGITQQNRNPLLGRNVGADGLKTGHTEAAGYGLAASAERDGRRLIMVLNGLPSKQARAAESLRLIEWGFREFRNFTLFEQGIPIEKAPVWLGDASTVPVVARDDIRVTLPRQALRTAEIKVTYDSPVPAPVEKGTRIATLSVSAPGMDDTIVPLYAGESVDRLGFTGRISAALGHLIWGRMN